jgi:adenosylcobinamide-GDP ribazoletransferase
VSPDRAERARHEAQRAGRAGALAATFLTVLPLRLTRPAGDLGAAAPWFPIVGAGLGALAGGLLVAAEPLLCAQLAATLAVVALVAVTGGLHVDGLADCADGLGARGGGSERRLAVMRDPAIGVFGALALLAWGALLIGALARLGGEEALRALVVAAAIGRWAALAHAAAAPPARPDGLGAGFVVTPAAAALSAVFPVALALVLEPPLHALAALLAGVVAAALVSLWARAMLGGRTGDTLGATVALGEVAACLALVAAASP